MSPPPPPPLLAPTATAALLEIESRRRTALAVAAEIASVDGRLRAIAQEPGWRGPAARAFVDAVERSRPAVGAAADHVEMLGLALETAAARLRQQEAHGEP